MTWLRNIIVTQPFFMLYYFFQFEELYFPVDTAGISCKTSVRAYNSVTRNDKRYRIMTDSTAYSLCRHLSDRQ